MAPSVSTDNPQGMTKTKVQRKGSPTEAILWGCLFLMKHRREYYQHLIHDFQIFHVADRQAIALRSCAEQHSLPLAHRLPKRSLHDLLQLGAKEALAQKKTVGNSKVSKTRSSMFEKNTTGIECPCACRLRQSSMPLISGISISTNNRSHEFPFRICSISRAGLRNAVMVTCSR